MEDELHRARLTAFVRQRGTGEEYLVPARSEVTIDEDPATGRATLGVTARAELDVATIVAEAGPLPPGVWDLWASSTSPGRGSPGASPPTTSPCRRRRCSTARRGPGSSSPTPPSNGKLSFDLDAGTRALTVAARPAADAARATRDARRRRRRPHPRAGPRQPRAPGPGRRASRCARPRRPSPSSCPPSCARRRGAALVAPHPAGGRPGPVAAGRRRRRGPERGLGLVLDVGADGEPPCGARRRPARPRPRRPRPSPLRRALARVGPLRTVARALRR